ncbi:MAG TPA: cyclopropane-fatty-acyl-phospholipid synthase family protein [Steroidobacteraceae bacterium]|jgi:cyclopropane-fatty-acyl-phospholipid synthase
MNASSDSGALNDFPEAAPTASEQAHSLEASLLRRLLLAMGNPPLEFVLWSGERIAPPGSTATIRVRFLDRATLFRVLRDPQMQFPEGYSAGRVEVEGDLVQLIGLLYRGLAADECGRSFSQRIGRWFRGARRNTLTGSRRNIHHHYDIGNEFYALWLGETMAYTCAYYPSAEATLEQAQVAKMDHVCRKLQLKPGDSVVEAGCGWGSLALHMARHYGARVRAFNISREQVAFAREQAQRQGLQAQVEFVQDDYRNISGQYDVFASVGMLEHVGRENYPELGRVVRRSLGSAGRGLIHSIGRNTPGLLHPWITRRIFPGAYAPSLAEMMSIFEPSGLSVLDVENIRLHYALTLRHWMERYRAAEERVRAMFDSTFVRMWRLYLAGSIAAFETGTLQLFQVVFSTRENNQIPMTREHLYST